MSGVVEIGIAAVTSSSDSGGASISRFHFRTFSGNAITTADLGTVSFQLRALYTAMGPHFAANYLWDVNQEFTVIDMDTGGLLRYMNDTSHVALGPGSGSITHLAGSGLRCVWRTVTVSTKRLMRGANYFTPISVNDCTNTGQPTAAVVSALEQACNNYLAGLVAAGITPVVYHRPPKGTSTGGKAGPITSVEVPTRFTSLRSRRS